MTEAIIAYDDVSGESVGIYGPQSVSIM